MKALTRKRILAWLGFACGLVALVGGMHVWAGIVAVIGLGLCLAAWLCRRSEPEVQVGDLIRPGLVLALLALVAVPLFGRYGEIAVPRFNWSEHAQKQTYAVYATVARYIRHTYPGRECVLIRSVDFTDDSVWDVARREGLAHVTVAQDILVYPYPATTDWTPDAPVFTAELLDSILAANPHRVVICCGVEPIDGMLNLKFWQLPPESRPPLVLIGGYCEQLAPAVRAGYIGAIVTYRPDATIQMVWKDPVTQAEAFDNKYILITSKNIDALDRRYPDLFDHGKDAWQLPQPPR